MIDETLRLPIDIHGGGNDLIFPHHENEMAQGICADHAPAYANYWMHNGFLNFGDEKMSKSLGNVVLVHDLVTHVPGEAIRWALLAAHYRQPLAWTGEALEQATKALDKLYGALRRTADVEAQAVGPSAAFLEALEDDLNTPRAFAELHALAARLETTSGAERAAVKGELIASAHLIGFLGADPESWFQGAADPALKARIDALIAERVAARTAKDWLTADRIRAELTALNVEVMDNATGATWRIREKA
jgi:cysteinyl-tRNA synthetase